MTAKEAEAFIDAGGKRCSTFHDFIVFLIDASHNGFFVIPSDMYADKGEYGATLIGTFKDENGKEQKLEAYPTWKVNRLLV